MVAPKGCTLERISQAIDKGLDYLKSKVRTDHWEGFPTLAGESDIWVTGYILTHIQDIVFDSFPLREIQNYLIQSQHRSGGWSYSSSVPPDADSTSWCLMALESCSVFSIDAKKRAMSRFL